MGSSLKHESTASRPVATTLRVVPDHSPRNATTTRNVNANVDSNASANANSNANPPQKNNHREYPTSRSLPFPYPTGPYPQQAALMDTLLQGIPRRNRVRDSNGNGSGNGNGRVAVDGDGDGSTQTQMQTQTQTQTQTTRILALESPTGTGKSLSLACASLAWLDYEEYWYYRDEDNNDENDENDEDNDNNNDSHRNESGADPAPAPTETSSTGLDWLDSWQPPKDDRDADRERNARQNQRRRRQLLLEKLAALRLECQGPAQTTAATMTTTTTTTNTPESKQQSRQRLLARRENCLRTALTRSRMDERKRLRDRGRASRKRPRTVAPRLAYERENDDTGIDHDNDNDNDNDGFNRKRKPPDPGTAEWLLDSSRDPPNDTQRQRRRPPQIVYAARTHSQLSQFVSEVKTTARGRTLRVVALAGRGQGLCGELAPPGDGGSAAERANRHRSGDETRLTEACLDRRKTGSCSHHSSDEAVSTLAVHGLAFPTDVEELAALGASTKTCAYYAARRAVGHAQLVVVPYGALCSPETRASLGLELHSDTLVVVDEAHNLPGTISSVSSAVVTLGQAELARAQLEAYLSKYVDRLSATNLRWLGQLKRLLRGLLGSMTREADPRKQPQQQQQQQSQQQQQQQSQWQSRRSLLSSSEFLVSESLDAINLFPILNYMKESKLSQKLLGFLPPPPQPQRAGAAASQSESASRSGKRGQRTADPKSIGSSSSSSHISPMSIVETFLEKLTYASDGDGKVVIDRGAQRLRATANDDEAADGKTPAVWDTEPELRFCVLNPSVHAGDDLWRAPRAVALVGGTLQPLDVMMRELVPGSVAEHAAEAQERWNRTTSGGCPDDRFPRKPFAMRLPTENPYAKPSGDRNRSTVGSRSQSESQSQSQSQSQPRVPSRPQHRVYRSHDFWAFSCGHVVDPSHVLLQSLTTVNGVSIDVRHKTRSTPAVTAAIGSALVRLCESVPTGLVVFLPSYKYEAMLVEAWKRDPPNAVRGRSRSRSSDDNDNHSGRSIWKQLEAAKTVVREPRDASQVEATLALYSRAATNQSSSSPSASKRGALLLSVVGGKLSEGINFADDLCRCVVVVGLPFADRSDPLLREKLRLVGSSSGSSGAPNDNSNCNYNYKNNCTKNPGSVDPQHSPAARAYYKSLCLRAVNQSVGRAIRHARDWATIVLMDARYPADEGIANGLPSWLTESTPSWRRNSGDLEDVIARTDDFFAAKPPDRKNTQRDGVAGARHGNGTRRKTHQ